MRSKKSYFFNKIDYGYIIKLLGIFVAAVLLAFASRNVNAENADSVAMYRMFNPHNGEHFYTSNKAEKGLLINLGWDYEGVGWMAPVTSGTPVYRLYNGFVGDHHYTMDENERQYLIQIGWNDEGIGWYSDDNMTVPVLRQFNPNNITGAHNYTTSSTERDYLVQNQWNDEGVGWYATDLGDAAQEQSKSEGQLRSIASTYGNVGTWGYADYDGDGSGEAFAVIGNTDAYHDQDVRISGVIFINEKGNVRFMIRDLNSFAYYNEPECIRFCGGKGFFWFDYGAYGSGYQTALLSVKNENPYELNLSKNTQGFYQDANGFYTTRNDYSKGYLECIKVELLYDENTQQFYKGRDIGSLY